MRGDVGTIGHLLKTGTETMKLFDKIRCKRYSDRDLRISG
jgi:hypothetical protein